MAHWIIEDKGFGGIVYKCSNCEEIWNDYCHKFSKDVCDNCGEVMDEDADEYIGDILNGMPEVKTYSDYAKETLIFPHTIGDITYYNKEELIIYTERDKIISPPSLCSGGDMLI